MVKEVKVSFYFGQIVKSKCSDNEMYVGKILVNESGKVSYGCLYSDGNYKYFEEYELESDKDFNENSLGFRIRD